MVPKALTGHTGDGEAVSLWQLWSRRQSTKFNGVGYVVQRGAEAVYSSAGQAQVAQLVNFYMENAAIIRQQLQGLGLAVYGRPTCSLCLGSRPQLQWVPGSSLTNCFTRPMLWAPPGLVLALPGRVTCAFQPLIAAPKWRLPMARIARCRLQMRYHQPVGQLNSPGRSCPKDSALIMPGDMASQQGAATVLVRQEQRTRKRQPLYRVLLHNDPVNTRITWWQRCKWWFPSSVSKMLWL